MQDELRRIAIDTSIDEQDRITQIARLIEHRSGRAERSEMGSFFTPDDVAYYTAMPAIWLRVCSMAEGIWGGHASPALRSVERAWSACAAPACVTAHARYVSRVCSDEQRAQLQSMLAAITIHDPCVGAGALLVGAWRCLQDLQEALRARTSVTVSPAQLSGTDVSADAAAGSVAILELACGPGARISCADSIAEAPERAQHDVIVSNPPYSTCSQAYAPDGLLTASCGNTAAWSVERDMESLRPGGTLAVILPISISCVPQMQPLRQLIDRSCDLRQAAHFDTIPQGLFPHAVQRISIVWARKQHPAPGITFGAAQRTSRYHRFLKDERAQIMQRLRMSPEPNLHPGAPHTPWPKLQSRREREILALLDRHQPISRYLARGEAPGTQALFYKRRWSYFLLVTTFIPRTENADGSARPPSELKQLHIKHPLTAHAACAVYSSSLFWWLFSVLSDNRNLNRPAMTEFPLPQLTQSDIDTLDGLGRQLMVLTQEHSEMREATYASGHVVRSQYFRQGATRPVLDQIDAELARIYAMTGEQLTFLLGYELSYRSAN